MSTGTHLTCAVSTHSHTPDGITFASSYLAPPDRLIAFTRHHLWCNKGNWCRRDVRRAGCALSESQAQSCMWRPPGARS